MTALHADARTARTTRRTGAAPPGYDRAAAAFRSSSRILLGLAGLAAAAGVGTVAAALILAPAGGLATPTFLLAGGFLVVLSLLPLVLGWRRRQRVAFLAVLAARWTQLARAGDPEDQIAPLSRAYAGLCANDVRIRVGPG